MVTTLHGPTFEQVAERAERFLAQAGKPLEHVTGPVVGPVVGPKFAGSMRAALGAGLERTTSPGAGGA